MVRVSHPYTRSTHDLRLKVLSRLKPIVCCLLSFADLHALFILTLWAILDDICSQNLVYLKICEGTFPEGTKHWAYLISPVRDYFRNYKTTGASGSYTDRISRQYSTEKRQDNNNRDPLFLIASYVAIPPNTEASVSLPTNRTGPIFKAQHPNAMQNRMVLRLQGVWMHCCTYQRTYKSHIS